MAIQYCDYDIKGTLAVAGNATFSSSQIYLTGGLTSAVPSQYLGRVTGGGGGVMVGRTAAQVLSDIGAVATINEGVGIKKSGTSTDVTISVNYDSADTDNLIFGSTPYTGTTTQKPYTPYILVADSNPGVSFGEVKSLRIQSIPINLLGDATGNVDMGGFKILDVSDPSSAQDAATKAYVDAHGGGLGPFLPLAGGTLTGALNGTTAKFDAINLDEDNKITFDDDADQWNFIRASSGNMEMAVGQTLKLINVEESIYGDIEVENLYNIVNPTTATATYVSIYTDSASSTVPRRQREQTPAQFLSSAGGPFLPLAGGTMTGNIVMGDNDITGIDQLTFSSGTYLTDVSSNYIQLRYASTAAGGIIVLDGDGSTQGYLYADGQATSSFGLLDGSGSWAVRCAEDAEVELRYDNSKKFETTTDGVLVTGGVSATTESFFYGGLLVTDSQKIKVGTSADLQIYHNGTHSFISDQGAGNLTLLASAFVVNNASDTENMIIASSDGSVNLYYDGSQKFRTTSTGVEVTGGDITLGGTGRIQGVDTVSSGTDAANKTYVDNAISGVPQGTVTGTGTSGQIAIFNGSSSITSNSGLSEVSTGVLYVNSQVQVKGVNVADYTVDGDTDTGLGSFDGSNGVSLVSKGQKQITVKENAIKFDPYTATAVSTTGPLNANQNNQAPTQDTLATLSVDPSGNVVRGEQEATFKFTLAQLNSTLGQTLISAPGADKAVIITYTDWMMEYSSTGSVNNQLEIRQANLAQANASVSVLPALRFNEIVNQSQSGSAPFYGFYTRDIPTGSGSQGRTYAVNKATTFHKQTSSPYPSGLTSISIKIRYRVFDVDTF